MSVLPDLSGRVRIDTTDLDRMDRKISESADNADTKMAKVGRAFQSAGRSMTAFASLPIAAGMAFSIKAASDLGEAMNITNITFGKGSKEIDGFAKGASKNLGISERAAREATASFGGLLSNLGFASGETVKWSKDLTVLASDLGSAFNKEPAEAARALGSALRGETEAIRAYNVMLSAEAVAQEAVRLGLVSSAKEMDANSKAQATLSLITQQTSRYQGDFANTAEGLANKTRTLRAQLEDTAASIGQQLLPAAEKAAGRISTMADAFATLTPAQQQALIGIGLFLAALGPVMLTVSSAIKAVELFQLALIKVGGAANFASLAAGGVVLAALGYQFVQASAEAQRFVIAATEEMDTANLESVRESLNKVIDRYNEVGEEMVSVNGIATLQVVEFYRLKEATEDLNNSYRAASQVLDIVTQRTGLTRDEVQRLAEKTGVDLTAGVYDATEALTAAHAEMQTGSASTQALSEANEQLSDTVKDAKEKYDAFKNVLDLTFGTLLSADEATLRLKERNIALGEAYKEAGGKADLNTEAGRKLQSAFLDMLPAIRAQVDALTESGAISSDDATQKGEILKRIEDLKKQYPALAPALQPYIDKVNSIPATKNTAVTVDTSKAEASLLNLRSKYPDFIGPLAGGPSAPARADGGPVSAGRLYMTGERGPEAMIAPANGTVLSAAQTRELISGNATGGIGGVTVNFYGPVGDSDDVVSAMPEIVSALRAGVSK